MYRCVRYPVLRCADPDGTLTPFLVSGVIIRNPGEKLAGFLFLKDRGVSKGFIISGNARGPGDLWYFCCCIARQCIDIITCIDYYSHMIKPATDTKFEQSLLLLVRF